MKKKANLIEVFWKKKAFLWQIIQIWPIFDRYDVIKRVKIKISKNKKI